MIIASLILDFTGIECTYGNIPNIPQAPDPRIEEVIFDKESDCQLLEDCFMDPVNERCGTWLDYDDEDYFDESRCILLKDWLEEQLAGKLPHRLSEIYTTLLRLVQKAIKLRTGIVLFF